MTESDITSEAQSFIHAGNAALRAGDAMEARKQFRRAAELEPDNVDAWLGMAGSVRSFKEKREHLRHALSIDPAHSEARASLAYVEEKLSAGAVLAPPLTTEREPEPPVSDPDLAPTAAEAGEEEVETLYCYRHPDRETGLLCVQCSRPICTECIRPAFVGQLCPECAHERRPRNYQVTSRELVIAGAVTLLLSLGASFLVWQFLPVFGFFMLLIAFFLGSATAEGILRLLDRLTHAKRGKEMQLTVGISYVLGSAPFTLLLLLIGLPHISFMIFTVVAVVVLVRRLR